MIWKIRNPGEVEAAMLYLYRNNNTEYAVELVDGSIKNDKVLVHFLSRTEGGKGRLPGNKLVTFKDLLPLFDSTVKK